MRIRSFSYLTIILLFHLVLLINMQFTLWPEMIVYPYLMNNDFLLYKDIINPYPPFFNYFLYIFTNLAGYHYDNFRYLTWLIICFIDILIYFITLKLTGSKIASLLSTCIFIFLGIPLGVNGLWYDLVIAPICLSATYYFYKFLEKNYKLSHLIVGTTLLSIAVFIKQQSVALFLPIIILSFINTKVAKKNYFLISIGLIIFAIPTAFLVAIFTTLMWSDTHKEFISYTVTLPLQASSLPGYVLLPNLRQLIIILSLFILLTPFLSKKTYENIFPLTCILALLFIYPRFDFFHLIPFLAYMSVIVGINLKKRKKLFVYFVLCFAILILSIFSLRQYKTFYGKEDRFFNQKILFQGSLLDSITKDGSKIYMQNSPDQLLVLAKLIPIKPWAIQFPWYFENSNLQDLTINSLRRENPEFVVKKDYSEGLQYEIGAYRPKELDNYVNQNYYMLIKLGDDLSLKYSKASQSH